MDYKEVDEIINSHGFRDEPAFRDVFVEVAPIPEMDGCPLGLYYPGSELIVIPPDGQRSVVLHELGHRHGDYYHGDLSEEYAEGFRKKYERGDSRMYLGNDWNLLPKMGRLFSEGEKGAIEVAFWKPLPPDVFPLIGEGLSASSRGEPMPDLFYSHNSEPVLRVEFTRGVDWITIVGGVLGGLFTAGIIATGYAIYKVADEHPWAVPTILFGLLAGVTLVMGLRKYGKIKI